MRIENNKLNKENIFLSNTATLVYFLILVFFVYKCFMLFPIWLRAKDSLQAKQQDFDKKQEEVKEKFLNLEDEKTDLAKERYQKEFFNKLDPGEELIILYDQEKPEVKKEEKEIKMYWWEVLKQNFLVWWKNSEYSK
jgi:hypothetical protein